MPEYDISEIERLIDGKLPWTRVQEIMKAAKDSDRFQKWVEILQARVPWRGQWGYPNPSGAACKIATKE